MPNKLTSRWRLLRALDCQDVDHVPCAFMSFSAMRGRVQDAYELVERELEMGLDSWLFIPSSWRNQRPNHPDLRGLPVRFPASVRTDLWVEQVPGEQFPVLHKEYHTHAGTLTTLVRKTDDWPHGSFVPFVDDYQIPRAIKPLVTSRADLDVLRTMLVPPSSQDIAAFEMEVERAKAFRDKHGVLLAGGWGVGADMAAWLCGLENVMLMAVDDPQLLDDLLATISEWNEQRMRVVLEAGVDLYIRRGWYESSDFWSPALYRRFILPRLKREAELAHEYGVRFGYNMTTGLIPMMDSILESGVDVNLGLDPLQHGEKPLEAARDKLGGRVCLWGGVNGAITVEEGSVDDVRQAVAYALEVMRSVNGFVLAPIDNITEITQNTWRNVDVLIETWKQLREQR
ncbi:MAG: uroporphyrinogen decarboxylase family protein [Anaerolineae bacterium]